MKSSLRWCHMVTLFFFVNCKQCLCYITDRGGGGKHDRPLWQEAEPLWGSLSISSTSPAAWISSSVATRGWPHSCSQDPFPGHCRRILLMTQLTSVTLLHTFAGHKLFSGTFPTNSAASVEQSGEVGLGVADSF